MNGFAKIFASMLRSTVWVGQPAHRKLVWLTLLMLADAEGNVWASVPGLAHDAEVTEDQVEDALDHFKKPDKHSRTKQHEGRRIVDIDGGWHVYNHRKYRDIQSTKQQKDAKRARSYRARKAAADGGFEAVPDERRGVTGSVTPVTHHAHHVTGRSREPDRPTSLQEPPDIAGETPDAAVTHHARHVRHAFPASVSPDQSLEDPDQADPDPDPIPTRLAKDGPARASGVFDAPTLQAQTLDVPDSWRGPKESHIAFCAEFKLDVDDEAARFRLTHFRAPFPATEAGVDKRFMLWLREARVRADTDRGKQFAKGAADAGGGRRGRMPTNGVAAVQPAEGRTGFESLELPEPEPERPRRAVRR